MNSNSPTTGYVLTGIGAVLVVIGIIWAVIVGFYPSDLPMLFGLLIVGAILAWVGQRMSQAAKRRALEQRISERDGDGH